MTGAEREPAPSECQASDDVGEPVEVEEHAAGGDRDGDSDREPDQDLPRTPLQRPAENEGCGGVERGRRR